MKERDDVGEVDVPLPPGARVLRLADDLALIELCLVEPSLPDTLSLRERQIAQAVFHGAKNRQIAQAHGVSIRTVGKQLESVYRKLGVASRAELVLVLSRGEGNG